MINIKSVYSPSENAIYPAALYEDYISAGTWPNDGVDISDDEAIEFNPANQPEGKILGFLNGKLQWVDAPPLSQEQNVELAEQKKASLMVEANAYCLPWQTQLLLGIINDPDKARLTSWMKYYQQLQQVDTSTAPDITWPTKPE